MWKRYLGPYAQIIGLDINKECKMYEEAQIIVEIGSQNDEEFLKYVVNTYGMFDVVIDDGSHMMGDILKSFGMLFKNVTKDGVYIVEDLHTAYWDEYGGGLHRQESFIEFTKRAIDALHSHYIRGEYTQEELLQEVAGYTRSITIIDSMVAFEKGRGIKKSAPRIGRTEPISNILDELTF